MTDWRDLRPILCPGTRTDGNRVRPCRHKLREVPKGPSLCVRVILGRERATGRAEIQYCERCHSWLEIWSEAA